MPKKLRIEFEGAYYHVMNRGRKHRSIFHGREFYFAFIDTLEQAYTRFDMILHAYCLMGNHYHLLIQTPRANISRIMRHINGVYTQRYNYLMKGDGPLFRGRFKSILVDGDAYFLQLSRYIHRNPIDMEKPFVNDLSMYPWSSYPVYIGKSAKPDWLHTDLIHKMLTQTNHCEHYKQYVANSVDEEIKQYYTKGNIAPIIGNADYREWIYEDVLPQMSPKLKVKHVQQRLDIDEIVKVVSFYCCEESNSISPISKRVLTYSESRKIAMYLCQQVGDYTLKQIADYFHLNHSGSASFMINQTKNKLLNNQKVEYLVNEIIKSLIKK